MQTNQVRQSVFSLLAAFIWGTAFVAQSVGAGYLGPFTFNAARSAVAFLFLLALSLFLRRLRGPGFSPEALHRGCEPFFGEAKSSEHFGLGLNIVSTLARLHGGSVTLANGEDGGGAVTVTFDVGSEA